MGCKERRMLGILWRSVALILATRIFGGHLFARLSAFSENGE